MLRSMTMLSAIARSEIASHTPAEPNASEVRLALQRPPREPSSARAHTPHAAAMQPPVSAPSPSSPT